MPEETIGTADTAACECPPCKRRKGDPSHGVHSGTIHSYSSTPRNGWVPRRTAAELANGTTTAPTFGLELETAVAERVRSRDLPGEPPVMYLPWDADATAMAARDVALAAHAVWSARNQAHHYRERHRPEDGGHLSADEAVTCAAPRGLWHPKHDGSVTGPEFASQPGTLAYWRSIRPHLAEMTRTLLHGGIRSHDGDTCGLHVNIGSDAFADGAHLERFLALVALNPRWSNRMAQRTAESAGRWCNMGDIGDASSRAMLASEWGRYGRAGTSHSSAVNLSHSGRVEFRLPRGTLRLDRLYAKLEWTAAMVEYTRDAGRPAQPSAFMHWAAETGDYPALVAYMRERFPARMAAVAS